MAVLRFKTLFSKKIFYCIAILFLLIIIFKYYLLLPKFSSQQITVSVNSNELTTGVNLTKYNQFDTFLLNYTKQHFINEPGKGCYKYSATGIVQTIWPILKKVVADPNGKGKEGIFVEAGAYDGTTASNTIWLETQQDWTGLLVECHPKVVPLLLSKQRKAFVSRACLSAYSHPAVETFTSVDGWYPSSSLSEDLKVFPDFAKTFTKFKVQTIPLYSLLAAANLTVIDFISLDVQSLEYKVLQNFPFDKIFVKVWLIEVVLLSPEDKENLKMLMKKNNYNGPSHPTADDQVYVHKSLKNKFD